MDAETGIRDGNRRFTEAIRAADRATMPSLYTADALILPPNAEAVRGTNAIERFWQAFFELGITEAHPTTLEVIPMGEYALEVGETEVFGKDGALVDRGKIMVLWKKERGTWKMHRDTWNSSTPL